MAMNLDDALAVIAKHRGQRIVIPTMASVPVWFGLSNQPLDFTYMPSAMGHGPELGLGLALAQPQHGVIVLNGDGSMLMNLGSLVTLAQNPAPVYLIVIDNGMYEITGGQKVAGGGRTDFAGMARAAGIPRVYAYSEQADWETKAAETLIGPGPVVIVLQVTGRLGQKTPVPPVPMAEQITRLRAVFASGAK
jgi:thiamine pyrophosphate-dependent acetolactate synthase large subunit-like protein